MVITRYKIKAPVKLKIAHVSDLHGKPTDELYKALEAEKPDVILVTGDLCTIGNYDDRLVDPDRLWKRLERYIFSPSQQKKCKPIEISTGLSSFYKVFLRKILR